MEEDLREGTFSIPLREKGPSDWDDPIVRVSRGARPAESPLKLVVILSDGIRGHINQSRSLAVWLSRLTGCEVLELEIPELGGLTRSKVKKAASRLLEGNRRKARDWLALAEGEQVIRTLGQWCVTRNIREGETQSLILLSAGSMPAYYNVALGYIWRCTCVTLMTPSVIGTDLFDFAIVPEHDFPKELSNIMTTIGAPNLIVRDELGKLADALLAEFPPKGTRRWGVLIGGDDKNYRLSAKWIHKQIGRIFHEAEKSNTDLYIATSRRTSREAESAIRRMASTCPQVRFLLLASVEPFNPIPSILGACDEIFVTDDSINMVSEAVTAGCRAVLLRAERVGALKRRLQQATFRLVSAGLLPKRALWGIPRFDLTFKSFEKMGLIVEFRDWLRERLRDETSPFASLDEQYIDDGEGFNEARRAARWIIENLGDVEHPGEDEE